MSSTLRRCGAKLSLAVLVAALAMWAASGSSAFAHGGGGGGGGGHGGGGFGGGGHMGGGFGGMGHMGGFGGGGFGGGGFGGFGGRGFGGFGNRGFFGGYGGFWPYYGYGLGYGGFWPYYGYGLGYGGYGLGYGGYGLGYGGFGGYGYPGYGYGYGGYGYPGYGYGYGGYGYPGYVANAYPYSVNGAPTAGFSYNSAYAAPGAGASLTQRRILGIDEDPVVASDGKKSMKITHVYPGTAAEKVGLQAGDVLHSVNGYLTEQRGNLDGSLASGADILWAEALLARNVEVHIVLPFALEEFVACSVAPSGHSWVERFSRCLDRAASVTYGTSDAFLGDDVLYRYCSEIAMGLTMVRARWLDAEVHQFALWDGKPARGEAGTAIDVALWQSTGHPVTVVRPPGFDDPPPAAEVRESSVPVVTLDRADATVHTRSGRVIRAMLFADVRGFSKLTDEQLPLFAQYVFGPFAEVLDRHRAVVEYSNTWGDALYAVISDAVSAAACALDLQEAIEHLAPEAVGLPADLALRLGGHVGPIFPVTDLILKRRSFVGSHVNRTARIEPVTPPGAVYVTSPFAAALELTDGHPFACDYVGHRPAAKDYGSLRMYRLRLTNTTRAGAPDRARVDV